MHLPLSVDIRSVRSIGVGGRAAFKCRVDPEFRCVGALHYLEPTADVADKETRLVNGLNIVWLPRGNEFLVQKVASSLNKGELSFLDRTIQKF